MPEAAKDELNTAEQSPAQQENIASFSEHRGKPRHPLEIQDPLEEPQPNDLGSRALNKPGEGILKKGKSTKSIGRFRITHLLTTYPLQPAGSAKMEESCVSRGRACPVPVD
jgi:hypothetical protein